MLDTNIAIYVIKRKPIEALQKFNQNAARICMNSISVAELYYGAGKSEFPERNLAVIEDSLSYLIIFDYSHKASTHFGNIKSNLSKQGNIIGENDIHIAAHARSEGLILVTNTCKSLSE